MPQANRRQKISFLEKRLRNLLPLVTALLLILLENGYRKGAFWVSGYEENAGAATILPYSGIPGFSYPLFFGLLSILLSFGKGILFFAPGMFLSLKQWRSRLGDTLYASYRMWILLVLGLVLVYAKWWSWYGGFFWGPRFFLLASLPASLVLAARLRFPDPSLKSNLITLLALSLSFWVGINGAVFDQQGLDLCVQDGHALEFLCWYVPEFSVLWRPFIVPWNIRRVGGSDRIKGFNTKIDFQASPNQGRGYFSRPTREAEASPTQYFHVSGCPPRACGFI